MAKTYIHYGHSKYDQCKFVDITENDDYLCDGRKPRNGLWGSDIESKYGWDKVVVSDAEILKNEGWRLKVFFKFQLHNYTKLLIINDENDFANYLKQYAFDIKYDVSTIPVCKYKINWKQVSKDYDAIEVYAGSNSFLKALLYGWDCDSICVFHKDLIIPIIY